MEANEVNPEEVMKKEIGSELVEIIKHTAGLTNLLSAGLMATLSLMIEKNLITFAEFANKAEDITEILNTEEGANANMLQIIMMSLEKKPTIIEKAE